MRQLLLTLLPALLTATTLTTSLTGVNDDKATAEVAQAEPGLSGVIVRHFNDVHSSIIADAKVTAYDAQSHIAQLDLRPYEGLKQNALPQGTWSPRQGDTLILAPDYSRALLIAPDATVYDRITAAFKTLHWVHPDRFAAFLSVPGHPSPTAEDFSEFCTENAVGLLYIHLDTTLYTLDCKSLALLHTADAPVTRSAVKLPFYSRVESIRKALWGTGSSDMDAYDPYYLELIRDANAKSAQIDAAVTEHSAEAAAPAAQTPETDAAPAATHSASSRRLRH